MPCSDSISPAESDNSDNKNSPHTSTTDALTTPDVSETVQDIPPDSNENYTVKQSSNPPESRRLSRMRNRPDWYGY